MVVKRLYLSFDEQAIFFSCVFEPSALVQITSFTTVHQGHQGIGTSVLDDQSPAVIGSQNEFLH